MTLRFRRLSVWEPVTFSGDSVFGQGIMTNVTDRGCRVQSYKKQVSGGSSLTLNISLPRREVPLKIDEAVVRWSDGREFGLEFVRTQPEEQDRLRRFVSTR